MLNLFGTVSLKALRPLFLRKRFVSERFDGRNYLFGFEVVLLEWEEGLRGSDSPIKEGIVTLNKNTRVRFIIFRVIHPSGRKYLPLLNRKELFHDGHKLR